MKTHELKLYANWKHEGATYGDMVLHLWFDGQTTMEMDLDIAIEREDIAYIDVIDLINHTTTRRYSRASV
jgi:hypothetical protein